MDTSDQASLWLRRSVDGASIVSASEALAIPDWCAQRCELIKDLTGISDSSDADLPLPLSMPELKAWLACAQQVTTVGDTGEPSLKQDDNTLTEAVKVCISLYSRPLVTRCMSGMKVEPVEPCVTIGSSSR